MREKVKSVLVLEDGLVFWGQGIGAVGTQVGELCFNTAMTGYQEILTDPSYASQIIVFTFPHIGNVGTNDEDREIINPAVHGIVLRLSITEPCNWRASQHLNTWLKNHNIIGICGIDTRRLTRHLRKHGAKKAVLCHSQDNNINITDLYEKALSWPGLQGLDLAQQVTTRQTYPWQQTQWQYPNGYGILPDSTHQPHVVAIDYGAKYNILRCLASTGCRVTVVPATASLEDIQSHQPDGIFLSNGPGDPMATGHYAVPVIQQLIKKDIPLFGICLGHQMLALAIGGKTVKMHHGHHGANHPVKNQETGKIEITSQNHGFMVLTDTLPNNVSTTHLSLFDGSNEGLCFKDKPIFSVQYHPEASPGPHDSHFLFQKFRQYLKKHTGM